MGDLFGIFPDFGNASDLERQTLYKQRYLRKGIYDTLPRSATSYERALAICADDVLFCGFQEMVLQQKSSANLGGVTDRIFRELREDLSLILQRRSWMTQVEADQHGFRNAVSQSIQFHSDRLCKGDKNADIKLAMRLQLTLQDLLKPWFSVKGYMSMGEAPWQWALALPNQSAHKSRCGHVTLHALPESFHMPRIWMTDKKVELLRERILEKCILEGEELEFARCFRRYLETGCETDMPLLASGLQRVRDVTYLEFSQNSSIRCKPGCDCSTSRQLENRYFLAAKRKSKVDPKMIREKRDIALWFRSMDLKDRPAQSKS